MNTAAGLASSPLTPVAGLISPTPVGSEPVPGSDFAAAFLAASMMEQESEPVEPDAVPVEAALPLLAGLLAGRPVEPAPQEAAFEDGGGEVTRTVGIEVADRMRRPVMHAAQAVEGNGPFSAVGGALSGEWPVVTTAADVVGASAASTGAAHIEAPPQNSMGASGIPAAMAWAHMAAEPDEDSGAQFAAAEGAGSRGDAPSAGARLIGSLLERIPTRSMEVSAADADSRGSSGPGLYASTQESVASAAGQVSTSPEAVRSAVGSPRWANELGSRVLLMSVRGQQEGSLSLTPEHLGPVEVRISVGQDATNIWFGAQHADTRNALTEALPRLREMFAASGLALGHAGVSQEMPRQEARRAEFPLSPESPTSASTETAPVAANLRRPRSVLLDAWA